MNEAKLMETGHGLVPEGEGWFVLNTTEALWQESTEFGRFTRWEGRGGAQFQELGINVAVLQPGQPACMYHGENAQENFLVLAGEGILIVEGEERPLKAWDFVHCPPWVKHLIVAAGSEPFVVIAVGARNGRPGLVYPVDEVARKHGASVERETNDGDEAYAGTAPNVPSRYVVGELPGG
ncbi:MAG: cupin domain-containing protein [Gaiellaceae bacterium]